MRMPPHIGYKCRSLLFVLASALLASGQNIGTAPQPLLDGSNLYSAFGLALNDQPGTRAAAYAAGLQVAMRASKLGLTSQAPLDAWTDAQPLLTPPIPASSPATAALFNPTTASALNVALASPQNLYIRLTSPFLAIDQPIDIPRDGVTLDLGSAILSTLNNQAYFIRIVGRRNVTITGGTFTKGNSAIYISKSVNVVIDHTQITGLTGDGIVLSGSSHVLVTHNRISGLAGPGVVIIGATSLSAIEQNDIGNGTGSSNWAAGILVSDRNYDLSVEPRSIFDLSFYGPIVAPIRDRLNPPHDNLIAFNHVTTNTSSGIYFDGGIRMTVYSNIIQGNAKEGMCLDNGATANVVTSNTFQQNGNRWGQTDDALRTDFVLSRLPDGTAIAKLPGISIDNAMYNFVYANNISHNFGGGVKMVRTAYFNVVGMNIMESNNDGASIYFRFFGVQLGSALADAPSAELDFTPSRGNIVFSNLIRGSHGAGIFVQGGSDQNEMFDNVVMDAKDYAIESQGSMQNQAWNNLTNLPSFYVDGCCSFAGAQRGRPPGSR
jgi:parallel beta-helix repeat protein